MPTRRPCPHAAMEKAVQILVDDLPYRSTGPANQTIQALVKEVCSSPQATGRLVVALSCDGDLVPAERLGAVLESSVEGYAQLELQTVPICEQVMATLAQAIAVLRQAHELRIEAADRLNEGRQEAAMAAIQKVLEVFKQVQQTTIFSAQLLEIDLESLSAEGRTFIETLSLVKDQLNQLKAGMENQDFVLVSDALRYDLGDVVDAWLAILECLHGRASA